jgi:hypothetical protein
MKISIFSVTLTILTILTLTTPIKSAFCKFLLKDYFNLDVINYVSTPYKINEENQIYPTLCHDYASPHICEDSGNVFLLKKKGQSFECTSLANSRSGSGRRYKWDRIRIPGVELWDTPEKFEELVKKYADDLNQDDIVGEESKDLFKNIGYNL